MKRKATFIINGKVMGYYVGTDEQTDEDFEAEVKRRKRNYKTMLQSYMARKGYHGHSTVKSEAIIENV